MKGPFAVDKEYPNWDEEGEYKPVFKTVPQTSSVSIWNFYPDPDAQNMDEAEYVIERHKMSRSQLRALKRRPFFRSNTIDRALEMGEDYDKEWWEHAMEEDNEDDYSQRFEVLEFWGFVDRKIIEQYDVDIPKELKKVDQLSVNVWICNGCVLRLVMNPFTPAYLPYYATPYEMNPYNIFGVGVAENMDDSQKIMNGHARMAFDNVALSGSLVFDVDETSLVGGQSMEIYPGKVFRRQAGMPGTAINGLKFPNTSQENMMMFDKFRQLADEQTGIPSYSHGQTVVQSMTRTASGMSMLLGAASLNIKTVIKNLDDFLLKPLGEAYFQWNMQFLEGKLGVEGDLEVKATGTNSLMQKEVRSQRLTTFLQTVQNPAVAPFVKINKLISELAYSLELDPDELMNDPEEAALMAQIIGMQNNVGQATGAETGPGGQQPGGMGGPEGTPQQPTDLGDTGTGGGNIGIGNIPQSGEAAFAGTPRLVEGAG